MYVMETATVLMHQMRQQISVIIIRVIVTSASVNRMHVFKNILYVMVVYIALMDLMNHIVFVRIKYEESEFKTRTYSFFTPPYLLQSQSSL